MTEAELQRQLEEAIRFREDAMFQQALANCATVSGSVAVQEPLTMEKFQREMLEILTGWKWTFSKHCGDKVLKSNAKALNADRDHCFIHPSKAQTLINMLLEKRVRS